MFCSIKPPEQVKWCSLLSEWQQANSRYQDLDQFARQSAKRPDATDYSKRAFEIAGPSGTFTHWVGSVDISTTDVNGMARIRSLPCAGTSFGTADNGTMKMQNYPGAGFVPFTSPAALIAIPSHSSPAVVSGHLFQMQPVHPQVLPFYFVTWDGDDDGLRSHANSANMFGCAPYLAVFTRIALPKH